MTDLLCGLDLDPYGRELNDPIEELSQDLIHRAIEVPNSNIDEPDRGVGLEETLSGTTAGATTRRLESDWKKDDRVTDVRATTTLLERGSYSMSVDVIANESKLGITLESDGGGGVRVAT